MHHTAVRSLLILCLAATSAWAAGPAQTLFLEDMDLSRAEQGWGRPQVRRSIRETPLTMKGRVFEHGVGAHSDFVLWIDLKGSATRFTAMAGIDDVTGGRGSVRFRVMVDGKAVADTGVVRGGEAPKAIDADLTGAKRMGLLIDDAGDGIDYDNADWADARITYSGAAPTTLAPPRPPREKAVILTPRPGPAPKINGPKVFGARPGHPFVYRVPATGLRPMTFSARGLPKGLALDPRTGIITGAVARRGTYRATLRARNARGAAERPFRIVIGDTLALTPPMGWNSWYVLLDRVTDRDVRAAADAMVKSGMADHGYAYVNIDDCWAISPGSDNPELKGEPRDALGRINSNKRFPDMRALTAAIHAKGLKAGIYTSPGPLTCAGFTGSYGHEEEDARRFSEWGFDFLKYDWCSYGDIAGDLQLPPNRQTPAPGVLAKLEKPYALMGSILARQPRDFVYNLCQYGMGNVSAWGRDVGGHSWRTTGDLGATSSLYQSLSNIGFGQSGLEKWAGPGHWNDPDYLMIGWITWKGILQPTPLTPNEQYTYMSLWSLLSAPLFLSGDMTRLDAFTVSLLCNDEVIDVDQDPLGKQGRRVAKAGDLEVWAKDLEDGSKAVGLFNRGEAPAKVTARWTDLGLSGRRIVRDLWRQKDLGAYTGAFTATVPRHGASLVRIRKAGP